ncbi:MULTISPECIES: STAS domain-containing protein [Protofrankia]|uniref:Anti-sigma factor antagonist n=1 Tax=Protofrankia coriariae TaxID=1562887 RepID=A0ABR5F153_9ACTN|nr:MULTISPECIES: STAS domain-containing protein [Protofrankia]KLL10448.1 anti-sigma factor antagonist [Protofrankia coriariae]ONH33054.1 anti-anti-sigma factor [Protofrankia sp. BMG5.30]
MYPSVRVEVSGRQAVVVRPIGDVDYSSLEPLREALLDARIAGARDIVVDLAEVSFMDSQGLAVILFAHQRQRSVGGRLILRSPSEEITRLLCVTNVAHVIDVESGNSQRDPAVPRAGGEAPRRSQWRGQRG